MAPSVVPAQPGGPKLSGEQLLLRAIAGAGVIITVLGVGFAVAVAIQNGWLGPGWRVILAAVLSVVLLGAAILVHRRGGPSAGAAALLVTSILTAFLLVLSLVGILEWWSPGVGAAAFVLLWAVHLLTYRAFGWRAVVVTLAVLGAGLSGLYVWLSHSDILVWAVVLLPFVVLGATWGDKDRLARRWAMLGTAGASVLHALQPGTGAAHYLVAVAAAATIVALSVLNPVDERSATRFGAVAGLLAAVAAALMTPASFVGYALPAAVLAVHVLTRGRAPLFHTHTAWLLPISLLCTLVLRDALPTALADVPTLLILAGFCVFLVVPLARGRAHDFGLIGWLVAVVASTLPLLSAVVGIEPLRLTHVTAALTGLVCAVALGFLIAHYRRLAEIRREILWPTVIAGLLLSMYAVVTVVVWASYQLGGEPAMETGYLLGHCVVSVGWMLLAAWALLGRAPVPAGGSLWVGGFLAAAAVLKLVFFDLQALTGVARALAFLACGLVLLTIVSLRSRGERAGGDQVKRGSPAGTDPYTTPRP